MHNNWLKADPRLTTLQCQEKPSRVLKELRNLWVVGVWLGHCWGSSHHSPISPSCWGSDLLPPSPRTPPRCLPSVSIFHPHPVPTPSSFHFLPMSRGWIKHWVVTHCRHKYVTISFDNRKVLQVHIRTYTAANCL